MSPRELRRPGRRDLTPEQVTGGRPLRSDLLAMLRDYLLTLAEVGGPFEYRSCETDVLVDSRGRADS